MSLPFEDDFGDNTADDDGWTADGDWTASDGEAHGTTGNLYVATSDADLEVQFTYSLNSTTTGANQLNALFRFNYGGIGCGKRQMVNIRPDRIVLRELATCLSFDVFAEDLNADSVVGQEYRMRIVANDGSVSVWRDGELIFDNVTVPDRTSEQVRFSLPNGSDYSIDDVLIVANGLGRSRTFTYNDDNSLASYTDYNGTTNLTYDAWGRLQRQRRVIDSTNHDIWYTYGMDGRLVRTDGRTWPDFGFQVSEGHRGDGRRHSKNVWQNDLFAGEVTSYYYGAGFQLLNEKQGAGVKTYVAGLAEANGSTSSIGDYSYYTHDHLGSTRLVTDETENIDAAIEYTPYGTHYYAQGGNEVSRRFTGHTYDAMSGQYSTPFRTYDPRLARWLQRDPLGMIDGPNMYAYVGGNPVNFWDPFGLEGHYPNPGLPKGMGPDPGKPKPYRIRVATGANNAARVTAGAAATRSAWYGRVIAGVSTALVTGAVYCGLTVKNDLEALERNQASMDRLEFYARRSDPANVEMRQRIIDIHNDLFARSAQHAFGAGVSVSVGGTGMINRGTAVTSLVVDINTAVGLH